MENQLVTLLICGAVFNREIGIICYNSCAKTMTGSVLMWAIIDLSSKKETIATKGYLVGQVVSYAS